MPAILPLLRATPWGKTLGDEDLVAAAANTVELFNPLLYPGTAAQLQLSQEEIGLLSGVSRQRANQALQVLEKAGLLKIEYGGVRVLDVEGLKRFG